MLGAAPCWLWLHLQGVLFSSDVPAIGVVSENSCEN